jgi:hypothetical protein
MNAVLAPEQTPTLAHFPDSIADLPEPHRVVLALVVAHSETFGGAISWQQLIDSTVVAIASPDFLVARTLAHHNVLRTTTSVVGDLFDYGLLVTTEDGLSLSDRAEKARCQWNGEFTALVETAKRAAATAVTH